MNSPMNKYRGMSRDDLRQELIQLRREQLNLRIERVNEQLANTARLRGVRRDIARVKTAMNEIG